MGFDLFLAAVSIVAASIATWALLRLFSSSDARQAIPLRTDGGFADPSHTTDGGVTIDGKVTADGESASDIDGQPTDHLGKRLVIALILTIPTFVITLLALAKIAMPGWLTNPWPHAIVITPVMFYCAAPIHHRGLPHCSGGVRTAIRWFRLAWRLFTRTACCCAWCRGFSRPARAIRISRSSAWSRRFRWLARLSGNTR